MEEGILKPHRQISHTMALYHNLSPKRGRTVVRNVILLLRFEISKLGVEIENDRTLSGTKTCDVN